MPNKLTPVLMITHDSEVIDRRIVLEAMCLAQNGYIVTILSPAKGPKDLEHDNITYVSIVTDTGKKGFTSLVARFVLKYCPLFFKHLRDVYLFCKSFSMILYENDFEKCAESIPAEIVFAHDLPALPVASRIAQNKGGHLIYDSHEYYLGQKTLGSFEKKSLGEQEKQCIYKADAVITVNESIAKKISVKYRIDKPEVIYNCVDWERPDLLNKKYIHELLGISYDLKILLYQGGFINHRNLLSLVELASFLPSSYIVVCVGWGPLEKQLIKLAKKRGVWKERFFIVQRVEYSVLQRLTVCAFAGLIPYMPVDLNTQLCTPNKLFEFISCGVPILYHKELTSVAEIVRDKGFGSGVNFQSPKEAATQIVQFGDDDERMLQVTQSYASNKEYYSWENQERTLLGILKNLK